MGIANELITRGWNQGALMGADGSVCLGGACSLADGHTWTNSQGVTCPERNDFGRSALVVAGIVGSIARYNDAELRTFDEVLRLAKEVDEILDAA